MNILNFLIKETRVAGVEISDKAVRIAYFRHKKGFTVKIHPDKTELAEHELILIEQPFAANIIKEGTVANKELLGKMLKDIWDKAHLDANGIIVSIPENKIYSHIFPFPKTVNKMEMEDAISLTINFQLPVKKSDMYIGYENAGDSNVINEVLISAIPKSVINDYVEAFRYAGIHVIALESHLSSIARSIKLKLDQTALFTKKSKDGATIFIVKDGVLRFSRTYPPAFIEDGFLAKEAEHIKISTEFDKKTPVAALSLGETGIREEFLRYPELKNLNPAAQSKWLIAMGAAIRGEIPKGTDNRISLLPVGTVEAYAYQKTMTFVALMRNIIIGISIFFTFAFLASYLFISTLSQTTNKSSSNIIIEPPSSDILEKEELVNRTNSMAQAGAKILSTTPNWSILLDEISSRVTSDIIITNFSVSSITQPISIVGTAKDRDTLNEFKKSLLASTFLKSVDLPITNLEQKGNIPFSITVLLRNPIMLYYK